MSAAQRQRKINKLHRLHIELSSEARNGDLPASERMMLARAADTLFEAIAAMEAWHRSAAA